MPSHLHVAIVGSSGAVGQELLRVLAKRNFPIAKLSLFASKHSAGQTQQFQNNSYSIQELTQNSFAKAQPPIDIAFFSAGGGRSREFVPLAVKAGAIAIDNSSAFRMDKEVPLVVPEVNPEAIKQHKGIIANPNCSTIILLMAVTPIHQINPVRSIVVSTYQAASGAGQAAMQELRDQSQAYLSDKPSPPKIFRHPIAFNAFSHDSQIEATSGYNEEEIKMIHETHKILNDETISLSPTCIRIPTFRAHAESIHLQLQNAIDLPAVQKALTNFSGTRLIDERENNYFPMPSEASHNDEVLVGRLRTAYASTSTNHTLSLWCCGDQILKGAALNAVQIAEIL